MGTLNGDQLRASERGDLLVRRQPDTRSERREEILPLDRAPRPAMHARPQHRVRVRGDCVRGRADQVRMQQASAARQDPEGRRLCEPTGDRRLPLSALPCVPLRWARHGMVRYLGRPAAVPRLQPGRGGLCVVFLRRLPAALPHPHLGHDPDIPSGQLPASAPRPPPSIRSLAPSCTALPPLLGLRTRHTPSSCFLLSRLRFRTPLLFALHRSSPGAHTLLPPSPTAPLSPHLAIAPLDSPLTLPLSAPRPRPTPLPSSQPQPLCAVAGDDQINRWLYAEWINLDVQMYDAFGHAGARGFDDACRGPRSDRVRAHRQDRDPHRE